MEFPLRPDEIITLEELKPLRPTYSREYKIRAIIDSFDHITEGKFDMDVLRETFQVYISGLDELTNYLEHLRDPDLDRYFNWIFCFNGRTYREFVRSTNYEIKTDAVIKELLRNGFHCLGSGLGRKVFDLGDWVLKVPYTSRFGIYLDIGIVENNREIQLYNRHDPDLPPISPVIQLSYQDRFGNVYPEINLMRKVYIPRNPQEIRLMYDKVRQQYPGHTHWSFGYDDNQKLVVYDFD